MIQDQATGSGHAEHLRRQPHRHASPDDRYPYAGAGYDAYYRSPDAERAARLTRALGWFSVGLGLAQLLAPRQLSRAIGIHQRPALMRTLGARELASGIGILTRHRPDNWLWARAAGDAIDLTLLAIAARSGGAHRRLTLATAAVAGVAVLDVLTGMEQARERAQEQSIDSSAVRVVKSITINRTPEECYRFWHDFENFPRFMKHLESVALVGANRMRWKAVGPAGMRFEWDAELEADEPGRYLAWRSLEGSEVDNAGTVRFEPAPGARGAIVRIDMTYRPPAGKAGGLVAKMFGEEPSQQIDEDLRRFKWLIETGEIPPTVGQPSGMRGALNRLLLRKGEPG